MELDTNNVLLTEEEDMDELQKTIHRWCLDDNGKNVLYKKNGEERYPEFKLYKMIARTIHQHTPEAQLEFPFFSQFAVPPNEIECNRDPLASKSMPVSVPDSVTSSEKIIKVKQQ